MAGSISLGQKNLVDYLGLNITGGNIVFQYQTVPKQAIYPSMVVMNVSEELKGYQQRDVKQRLPTGSVVNEVYWGEEYMHLALEIIHNNRIARDNLISFVRNLFIKRGCVLHGGSVFTIENYRNLETPKEIQLNQWFSVIHFRSITPITFDEAVTRMDTIKLDVGDLDQTYTDEVIIH